MYYYYFQKSNRNCKTAPRTFAQFRLSNSLRVNLISTFFFPESLYAGAPLHTHATNDSSGELPNYKHHAHKQNVQTPTTNAHTPRRVLTYAKIITHAHSRTANTVYLLFLRTPSHRTNTARLRFTHKVSCRHQPHTHS